MKQEKLKVKKLKKSPYDSGVLFYWLTVFTCIHSNRKVVYRRFFQFCFIFPDWNYNSRSIEYNFNWYAYHLSPQIKFKLHPRSFNRSKLEALAQNICTPNFIKKYNNYYSRHLTNAAVCTSKSSIQIRTLKGMKSKIVSVSLRLNACLLTGRLLLIFFPWWSVLVSATVSLINFV